jgi:DNA-binding Lrp family transcriptional regulator
MTSKVDQMINFSSNERKMIKLLLDNGRITGREISKELNISPQACGKMRKKLEERGMLVGYTSVFNLKEVGMEAFAFLHMKFSSKFFNEFKNTDVFNKVAKGFGFLFAAYLRIRKPP